VRKFSALIVAAVVAASLAACSSPTTAADCLTGVASGAAASLVTATGAVSTDLQAAVAAAPTVDYPTPLFTKGVEKNTLLQGTGELLQQGDAAEMYVWVYDGASTTGTPIASGAAVPRIGAKSVLPFGDLAECATVGSRIAGTIKTADYPDLVPANGPGAGDTLVVVIDITARYLGKANGVEQIPQAGIPSVVLTPEGRPGVTIPNEAAPKESQTAVLKQGDGQVVKDGDMVIANFTALTWAEKEVFATTWDNSGPVGISVADFDPTTQGGMVAGLKKAIIGQKVGSQVIVVLPPSDGFGDAAAAAAVGVQETDTVVYVFDVLGIQK